MISISHLLADVISHKIGQDVSSSSLDALENFIPLLVSKETLTDGSPKQHKKPFRLRDCGVLLN